MNNIMKRVWVMICAASLCFWMAAPHYAAKPETTNTAVTNAVTASKNADEAAKNADEASKNADEAVKNAGEAAKNADEASKNADEASKNAGEAAKNAGEAAKNADEAAKNAGASPGLTASALTVGASAYPLRGKTMHAGDTVGRTPADPAGAVTEEAVAELLAADPAVILYVSQQFQVESGVFTALAQQQDAFLTLRRVESGRVISQIKLSGEVLSALALDEIPPCDMGMSYSPAATGRMLKRFYTNAAGTYQFGKDGAWSIPAEFAVRAEESLQKAQNLRVYVYRREKNTIQALSDASPWIDGNGYLHFHAAVSGDFIFTDGALTLKGLAQ